MKSLVSSLLFLLVASFAQSSLAMYQEPGSESHQQVLDAIKALEDAKQVAPKKARPQYYPICTLRDGKGEWAGDEIMSDFAVQGQLQSYGNGARIDGAGRMVADRNSHAFVLSKQMVQDIQKACLARLAERGRGDYTMSSIAIMHAVSENCFDAIIQQRPNQINASKPAGFQQVTR